MNKTKLVQAMKDQIKYYTNNKNALKNVDTFVTALTETIINTVANGEKVSIKGFGSFELVDRAERNCRNLNTGEIMTIPASKAVKFKPSKMIKQKFEEINEVGNV